MTFPAWLERLSSASSLVNALMAACGMVLLNEGVQHWNTTMAKRDMAFGRSPLLYGTQIAFDRSSFRSDTPWIVLLSSRNPEDDCRAATKNTPFAAETRAVDLWIVRADTSAAYKCDTSAAPDSGRTPLTRTGLPKPIPVEGFVVVNQQGRVIYGAQDRSMLSHIPGILRLFRAG